MSDSKERQGERVSMPLVAEPGWPGVEDSPTPFFRVRVDAEDWHPLDMALIVRPLPGFPENYAIACRRSEDDPIRDQSDLGYYGPSPTRFGEWEQPITRELFLRILEIVENARIPLVPSGGGGPCTIDGPPITHYTLEIGGTSFRWLGPGKPGGWEPLAEAADLMLAAVEAAKPVLLPPSYFQRRDL